MATMASPGDKSSLLPSGANNPSIDYSRPSARSYGPAASAAPVPSTASLLGGNNAAGSRLSAPRSMMSSNRASRMTTASAVDGWGWNDPEADDYLHNPDPKRDQKNDRGGSIFTVRGIANVGCLFLLLLGIIALFAGYPIITAFTDKQLSTNGAYNLGNTNGTGQIPDIPGFPLPIDPDTPANVMTRVGSDNEEYTLVFSDEFNKDGRTFYEGDDPYWTAVDFHYWPTGDLEWYDPGAITTEGGYLKITMTQEPNHDLMFKSGMLQSWNKMCFQYSYYIEVSVSLPGSNSIGGFWPGVWTMGNLGRPGYGATTEGLWPYTYDSCDTGTMPNQTWTNLTGPADTLDTGGGDAGQLSYLPGQRLSACTCKGQDHPGPWLSSENRYRGRGAPEVDVIEAQIDIAAALGEMSQSFQVAPFDDFYQFKNRSTDVKIYDDDVTHWNSYLGGPFQQAVSGLTYVPRTVYQNTSGDFNQYGLEVYADPNNRDNGHITWSATDKLSWTMYASAVGPNPNTDVGQRIIPEEPMTMIINFGMSNNFQTVDLRHLAIPNQMLVDYVRVYQRSDGKLGCDPDDYPTAKYIADHPDAYANPNLTVWSHTDYNWPKNKLVDSC